jgi:Kef-type K+ transport system membrane component KefB
MSVFVLFLIGAWSAWRRGCAVGLPLLVIACIPATLAFVLTNMRYSVTVQPLLFVFVATTIVSALEWLGRRRARHDRQA